MSWLDPAGLYRPGATIVHRSPLGVRLGGLALLGVGLVVLRGPWSALGVLVVTVVLAVVARLPWRSTLRGLAPVLVTAALVGGYQTWRRGWPVGVELAADLVSLVLAATVVTVTTRADALLDAAVRALRPLRRVGVDPEAVALAISLMLRTMPALVTMAGETRDAARARGLDRSPRALLVPLAIRAVGRAQTTAEALTARNLPPPQPR
ncbi:energy-coupling factor transporter transmembrane component T [Isoptericola sp. b441]|uniref:Energy-coupling factor transporter transmembrane component T n=1 Tax=Actinotalea lenta TaxID=3064654 RepID=A0ABT9DEJ3_9CELL|nr:MULTISPECIES: energy-coupling factor transporter transmembrane component T [unclassified Isoptericola]MDO8107502.1 energy-coupling factor transporter transmembrane component T [Isoptericola sp. b441]MDO8120838.1 energy-coupling factor transporter transmembrane component T [Isoptericola sp. b490]